MKEYNTYIFDIDGTLIKSDLVLPGAVELIRYLRAEHKQILVATNSPVATKQMISERLRELGLEIDPEEIITPIDALHFYFQSEREPVSVLSLIHLNVAEELGKLGWCLYLPDEWNRHEPITHVLLGMNEQLTYRHLSLGLQALDQGARLVGMNPDLFCPVEQGRIPDSGSLLACLELSSGQEGSIVGKPSKWMQQAIRNAISVEMEDCLFIGDSPYTDIKTGQQMGMDTLLLQTGISSFIQIKTDSNPTYVWPDLTHASKFTYPS